jgi:hypothetical protein
MQRLVILSFIIFAMGSCKAKSRSYQNTLDAQGTSTLTTGPINSLALHFAYAYPEGLSQIWIDNSNTTSQLNPDVTHL